METYVVWPDFWQTVAFIAACTVLVVMAIGRDNMLEAGNLMFGVLINKYFLRTMSILLLLGGFITTLCLLYFCNVDIMEYVGYIFVALIFPACIVACFADCRCFESTYSLLFAYAAGQSAVGIVFLIFCHFSYMWYLLGFGILDVVGIMLAELNASRCSR